MDNLTDAVAAYIAREKAANNAMRGADHQAIIAAVGAEFGVELDVLTEAVLDASFADPV